jgi:hypothetical protein
MPRDCRAAAPISPNAPGRLADRKRATTEFAMTRGPFYRLARQRRQLALALLAERYSDWQPFPARARAPRITQAALHRLMAR